MHDAVKGSCKGGEVKKCLYLQACLESRRTFTPMVYSADRISRAEYLAAQKRLSALLSYKLKREYSEMCGFVRARMSLVIVMSNSLLLRGPRDKGVPIRQLRSLQNACSFLVRSAKEQAVRPHDRY